MASKEMVPDPQDLLTCTICQVPDPETKVHGHSFCQSCLSSGMLSMTLSRNECKEVSQSQAFKSTSSKSKMADTVKQHQQYPEGPVCERHQEAQKLFCMNDEIFLCMSCSKSQEHEAHEVCPLEEAAEEYRKRLQDHLKRLDENLKDVKKLIVEEKEVPRTWAIVWTEQVNMSREVLEEKFQEISEFLSDEEEDVHSLVELNEEENEMFQNLIDHEAQEKIKNIQKKNRSRLQLSQHSKDLREMVTMLEEKSQMSDGGLLQDIGDTLSRSESLLIKRPEPFTPQLSDSYCVNLSKFLKKFQGEAQLFDYESRFGLPQK
ncbi:E3 ubiquitin-protein ligase TRIM17-like, partial [Petaurus breviceps papuanus]|uniref:E3 ubiquitin-protein ligase TRIM17-like n=1 Tax=Petaurus breviceps papuanus TaxID=3040969 RepID=UPI0036D98462